MKDIITKFLLCISYFTVSICFLSNCKSEIKNENEIQIYADTQDFKKIVGSTVKIVNVKFEITDVLFTQSKRIEKINDNPEDPYVIFAVLELDSISFKKLAEGVKPESEINDVILTKRSIRSWFPKEVKKSISKKGRLFKFEKSAYDSQLVVKSSHYTGYFIFLDENFIFLSLFSKGGNQ